MKVLLNYLETDQNLALYKASVAGGDVVPHEGNYRKKLVNMHNGRNRQQFSIDKEGFQLTHHVSRVSDFYDNN